MSDPRSIGRLELPVIVVLIGILAAACDGGVMADELVTEKRAVEGFSGVLITGRGSVSIAHGEAESLVIEASRETLDKITSEVVDGVLEIRETSAGWGLRGPIRMTLTYTTLESLSLSGSADVHTGQIAAETFDLSISGSSEVDVDGFAVDGLTVIVTGSGDLAVEALAAESIDVQVRGSGDIEARGTVVDQSVVVRGSGNVDTAALESRNAVARVSGSGNVELWVTDRLEAVITGSGDISYTGDAILTHDISGSGRLRRK